MNKIQGFAKSCLLLAAACASLSILMTGCETTQQPTTSLNLPLTRSQADALPEKDYGRLVAPGLKSIRVDGSEFIDTLDVGVEMVVIGDVTEDGTVEIQLFQFIGRNAETVCCYRSMSEAEGQADRYWRDR